MDMSHLLAALITDDGEQEMHESPPPSHARQYKMVEILDVTNKKHRKRGGGMRDKTNLATINEQKQ
jgi:hypothetical protein